MERSSSKIKTNQVCLGFTRLWKTDISSSLQIPLNKTMEKRQSSMENYNVSQDCSRMWQIVLLRIKINISWPRLNRKVHMRGKWNKKNKNKNRERRDWEDNESHGPC